MTRDLLYFSFLIELTRIVVLPLLLLCWVWFRPMRRKTDWIVRILLVGAYLGWIFWTGRWGLASIYLRYVWVVLWVGGAAFSAWRGRSDVLPERSLVSWSGFGLRVLFVALFGYLTGAALHSHRPSEEPLTVASPLGGGMYLVGHGGRTSATNYHGAAAPPQTYALDISRVDAWGARASSLLPTDLNDYAIYGSPVYSPISGRVVVAVDTMPDLVPPLTKAGGPAGNHVVVRSGDVYLFLAHLQSGSVRVSAGDSVVAGTVVGVVGNSGNTTEPHLHLHAVRMADQVALDDLLWSGEPVPLHINGRFLVRNDIF